MKMDILAFGTENTAARFSFNYEECKTLMEACATMRNGRFPGVLEKLPPMFDEEDLTKAVGNEEGAAMLMSLFDMEQALHQALHMFPNGHDHGDEDDDEGHAHHH